MRITGVISSLKAGGAERVMATLANAWQAAGHDVTLVLTTGARTANFYTIDPQITVLPLDLNIGNVRELLHGLRLLRRTILDTTPDGVISFIDVTNVLVLLALRGTQIPIIVSERIDPKFHPIGRVWETLRAVSYRWANAIVMQTQQSKQSLGPRLQRHMHVIPNPLNFADAMQNITPDRAQIIVAMGRLNPQKGFDLLIDAFAQIAATLPNWQLHIYGAGQEQTALQQQIATHALTHQIQLKGLTQSPFETLQQATIFVLSSRYEGFPNVLLEAMASGCAVISYDCPSGPADIITDQHNGWLVPAEDVPALASAIKTAVDNPTTVAQMGAAAREVIETYATAPIADKWIDLIRTA